MKSKLFWHTGIKVWQDQCLGLLYPSFGLHKSHYKNHHVFSQFSHDFSSWNHDFSWSTPQQSPALHQLPGYPSGIIIDGVTGEEVDPKSWQEPRAGPTIGKHPISMEFLSDNGIYLGEFMSDMNGIYLGYEWDLMGYNPSTKMIFDVENGSNYPLVI